MTPNLKTFFNPKSVAVVGASREKSKVGAIVLRNILESHFKGEVYPVNPNVTEINGLKCYPDYPNLPRSPDLAILAIPVNFVFDTLKQIGEKGTKNVIVLTAGFKETGPTGQELENKLKEIADHFGINILGPNCLGFVNNLCPINATFAQNVSQSSNLRFISQSGALASSLFDWCESTGVGFSEFITLGNKAGINENDVLKYFRENPLENSQDYLSKVSPVGLYLESISEGQEFLKIVREISHTNPVFVIKPGKSQAAAKAMQSHTGSLAGEDAVLDAALFQANVVRCLELEDFFDLARALSWENIPQGPKVAIISNAGGPAVISADAITREGLELVDFDADTSGKLFDVLPRSASIHNPVDVLGDALADRYAKALEIVLSSSEVNAVIAILTPQVMTEIEKTAELIGNLSKKYNQTIFCSFMGTTSINQGEEILNGYKIPSFRFPERAIATLAKMWQWKKRQLEMAKDYTDQLFPIKIDTERVSEIIQTALKENRTALDNMEANNLLLTAGIATPATFIPNDLFKAGEFAKQCGWPVVLKLSSPGLIHKTDIGGVITNITSVKQLEDNWEKMERKIQQLDPQIQSHVKIQLQKEIEGGTEVIVGIKRDSVFGPVIQFGAGGTFAELVSDLNLHLLPMELPQIKKLAERSKIYKILSGFRGHLPYALDKLYDLIYRLAKLVENTNEIAEMEINPVIVTQNDVWAVDPKVILDSKDIKLFTGPKFKGAVTLAHTNSASKYHELTFETDQDFSYLPGQYLSVKVANNRVNAYSIAESLDSRHFSLIVDTSPGGPGSRFFESLKVGDKISYLGPFGVFTYKPDGQAKKLIFLGTGSGCSPLRCIVDSALKKYNCQLPINFYFGLRFQGDIFWKDYFEELAKKYPNFRFNLTLSKPDKNWGGKTGHITDLLNNDFSDFKDCAVYLCGNKTMIEESTKILLEKGCPKKWIYSEKFF